MKENINDYRREGFINLDEYFLSNPEEFTYPYYVDDNGSENFWTTVTDEDEEKEVYIKPREYEAVDNEYLAYSELLYAELLKQVGIESADYDLAYFDGSPAVMSENVVNSDLDYEFIISGRDLLQERCYNPDEDASLDDLIDAVDEFCTYDYIDEDSKQKCIEDIQKLCIADLFAMSSDRNIEDFDFICTRDEEGNEILKLAPVCKNSFALCSGVSEDEIIDLLDNEELMLDEVNNCYTTSAVPQDYKEVSYYNWENGLNYFADKDEENLSFIEECAKNMNIDKAIESVEEKIGASLPSKYKEFARAAFDARTMQICSKFNLDYYEIMDEKYYDEEMEER